MTRVNDQDLPLIHQSLPEFQRDQIETFVPLDIEWSSKQHAVRVLYLSLYEEYQEYFKYRVILRPTYVNIRSLGIERRQTDHCWILNMHRSRLSVESWLCYRR